MLWRLIYCIFPFPNQIYNMEEGNFKHRMLSINSKWLRKQMAAF